MNNKTFKFALKTCIPVILGYLPAGFAFGLMITAIGYNIIVAISMSLFIYAGAGQYLAVEFFKSNASYISIALATFLINSKHMFYGLSLLEEFKSIGRFKPYMIFSLTDETYAVLTGTNFSPEVDSKKCMIYIAVINHISWIVGSFMGALLGTLVKFNTKGLDFAMTALFFVILTDQLKAFKSKIPFIIGTISAIIAWLIFGKSNILLGGSALSVLLLILFKKRIEKNDTTENNNFNNSDSVNNTVN